MFKFPLNLTQNLVEILRFKNYVIQSNINYVVMTAEVSHCFMNKFADFLLNNNEYHVIYPEIEYGKFKTYRNFHSKFNSDIDMFKIVFKAGMTQKFINYLDNQDFVLEIKKDKGDQLLFYHTRNKVDLVLEQLSSSERHFFFMYLLEFLDKEIHNGNLINTISKKETFLFLDLFDACFDGYSVRKFLEIIKNFKHFKCIIKSYSIITWLVSNDDNVLDVEITDESIVLSKLDKTPYKETYEESFKKYGHILSHIY